MVAEGVWTGLAMGEIAPVGGMIDFRSRVEEPCMDSLHQLLLLMAHEVGHISFLCWKVNEGMPSNLFKVKE